MSRSGDWIALASGRKWFLTDPDPEDVCIEDIAHALSMICRYGGHCRHFYSVAEHSCRVMFAVANDDPNLPVEWLLWALMHDAAEAYLGDVVRPLKYTLPAYRVLEEKTEIVILEGLGLPLPTAEIRHRVKYFDGVLLMTERRDLVNHCGIAWTPRAEPLPGRIEPWSPAVAEGQFLNTYQGLLALAKA